jgi:hypothetical protein
VREALGIGFSGGTSEGLFFVADVRIARPNSDMHVGISGETLSVMMPVRTSGTQRLIGIVPPAAAHDNISFDDVGTHAAAVLAAEVTAVNWFSTYKVHHRVAERFRVGRCFIAGDAGHIHSPVGGQGMNTGLGDAMNLGWKLGHVITGSASPAILDTYEPERIAFARTLIATTDAAFGKLVAKGWIARQLRFHIVSFLVRTFARFAVMGRKLFETVSQVRIKYRDSALSRGAAGAIRAGDRLPWVETQDIHAALDGRNWTAHAVGGFSQAMSDALHAAGIKAHSWADTPAMRKAGFQTGAVYLVRPDGHVGLADPQLSVGRLTDYLADFGICSMRNAGEVQT